MAHDLTPSRELRFGVAGDSDAAELAAMHIAVARDLTVRFGRGHWSFEPTQKSVGRAIVTSRVVVARLHGAIAGSFELQTKKPWAIDRTYFTDAPRPLYLLAMAVTPSLQRQGIGRRLLDEAVALARIGRPVQSGSTPTTVTRAPVRSTRNAASQRSDGLFTAARRWFTSNSC